eukprot:TRINITY_DN11698_c0_g1_i1.p2 TRINITY_DN11698_c0_g1~~TRINITY_DN11698_c0_g1_i1.p2  ORF type:complete len:176 (+),score=51.60 TRINITY_DN11698_c0_g1_i1:238-765(+)
MRKEAEAASAAGGPAPSEWHVVSSPFVRCVQTAAPVATALGTTIKIEPGICEVLSTFPPGLLSDEELRARFPLVDPAYTPVVPRTQLRRECGDSQAAQRAAAAALELRRRLRGPMLLVGHGASCLGCVRAFGGSGYVGYCSLTRFAPSGDGWVCIGTPGDCSHLTDAESALASAW